MLPEKALRRAKASRRLRGTEFFKERVIAIRAQADAYRRHYAALGKPLQPAHTLTGEAWVAAMDAKMERALGAIYP